jgi:hypothetical protein
VSSGIVVALLIGAYAAAAPVLSSLVKAKVQQVLRDRFESDLEIRNLQVSLFPLVSIRR